MINEMTKIFISLSSKDASFVDKLTHYLKTKDVPFWVYYLDNKGGDSIIDEINRNLNLATHFLLILSDNYSKSYWQNEELKAAMIARKKTEIKIIPLIITPTAKDLIPPLLQDTVYIDFSKDFSAGLKELNKTFQWPLMTDQIIYSNKAGKKILLADDQLIDNNGMKVLKKDGKIFADIPAQDSYAEITDERVFYKNQYFNVTWNNFMQSAESLDIHNLNEYKIILPNECDILSRETIMV